MLKRILFIAALTLVCTTLAAAQQDKSQRPSPPAQAQCKFSDGKTITVDYSSPRAKGRKIFGELVPYGQVWRTGANEATTFVVNENLVAAKGTNIPAGSSNRRQMDADHQQTHRRMGDSLQVRVGRGGACADVCFQDCSAGRKLYDFIRSDRRRLHDAVKLGEHSGFRRIYRKEHRCSRETLDLPEQRSLRTRKSQVCRSSDGVTIEANSAGGAYARVRLPLH
jgi:Protein of unknown function (DUF2911)